MVKITFEIDDELNNKFRKLISNNKGLYRGALQESLIEAIHHWIQLNRKKKKISKKNTAVNESNIS